MASTQRGRILTKDLSVGDTLVCARVAGFGTHLVCDDAYTVEKILATRLVLKSAHGRETRVIVKDGEVKTRLEGNQRDYFPLYTPDDDHLAAIREQARVGGLRDKARGRVDAWNRNPHDRDKAKALVAAITEWLDATEDEED